MYWRPLSPNDIIMRHMSKNRLFLCQIQEDWFREKFRLLGCKVEVGDILTKVLAFYAKGGLEGMRYKDLQAAVLGLGK